jgi:hypothetical protein
MCANDMIQVGYSAVHILSLKHILIKYNIAVCQKDTVLYGTTLIYIGYFMTC